MALNPIPYVVETSGAANTAPDGSIPIALYGADSGPTAVAWADVTGKPATFPPTVGTTATTAKAGNYVPTSAEVSNGLKAKAQIVALAPVAAPDATDEDTAIALANANKATINAIIAALKA